MICVISSPVGTRYLCGMKAMQIYQLGSLAEPGTALRLSDLPVPEPRAHEILVRVSVCGVCHTELDEIEGRTPPPDLPMIPGHQVVGRVAAMGPQAHRFRSGQRVGVAWIFSACGHCFYCRSGQENLCPGFRASGRDAAGGYAEYMCVPEDFAYPIPDSLEDAQTAPLLCAGAIGYRSLRLTGLQDGLRLGLTGFGASAHLVMKTVQYLYPKSEIFVFARDPAQRAFAQSLGAAWWGATEEAPPAPLDAIIDTTPAWKPIVKALEALKPGGRLVINAIRKESPDQSYLQHLDYARHLWMEKEVKSVANITRKDVADFLALAALIPIEPEIQTYPLEEANQALMALKQGGSRGAKVLSIG